MSAVEPVAPEVGEETFRLVPPKRKGGQYRLERRVWTNIGWSTFWHEPTLDFVTFAGSWRTVEELGEFRTPEAATAFMKARAEAASA